MEFGFAVVDNSANIHHNKVVSISLSKITADTVAQNLNDSADKLDRFTVELFEIHLM